MWMKLAGAFGLILAFTLALFLVVKLTLHSTAWELVGPYIAFAAPQSIFLSLAYWLRKWEERRPSPMRLAFWWGVSVATFAAAISCASIYSGIALHLIDFSDVTVFAAAASAAGSFGAGLLVYHRAVPRLVARSGP
jgi:hypothetical protein